jgi:glycosyltransferase involved in cell wall biosynthesis
VGIGDGETREETLAKIKEYGLENSVHWKGKVPYEEVKNFYLTHDVFFFTSLRDSCPAQLIEAMAYGLPVVTLNLHGQAIIVNDDTGIRCECSTPTLATENLKKAILSFYHHEIDITKMSNAAYQFALKQTWRKKIDTIVHDYY